MEQRDKMSFKLILGLVFLMAATRYHHFGDALHLPDASLAIFFIAGSVVSSAFVFPLLLVEAGVIDYLAVTVGSVSDWCITPAYWFLIPTYGVVWFAGRYCRSRYSAQWRSFVTVGVCAVVSLSVAFFISNASFYAFSGKFGDLFFSDYVARVWPYYVPYVLNATVYLIVFGMVYGIYRLWTLFRKMGTTSL